MAPHTRTTTVPLVEITCFCSNSQHLMMLVQSLQLSTVAAFVVYTEVLYLTIIRFIVRINMFLQRTSSLSRAHRTVFIGTCIAKHHYNVAIYSAGWFNIVTFLAVIGRILPTAASNAATSSWLPQTCSWSCIKIKIKFPVLQSSGLIKNYFLAAKNN